LFLSFLFLPSLSFFPSLPFPTLSSLPFPTHSLPSPSLSFPSIPFPSLPFPSLPFPSLFLLFSMVQILRLGGFKACSNQRCKCRGWAEFRSVWFQSLWPPASQYSCPWGHQALSKHLLRAYNMPGAFLGLVENLMLKHMACVV
jgi:hypothetical protein